MSQKTFLEQFKSLSYRQITRLPPFPHVFSASEVGLIRVWIMGYQGIMNYGDDFALSRLGKAIIL